MIRAFVRYINARCAAMVTEAFSDPKLKAEAAAILAARECPDFIEPPDEVAAEADYAAALEAWADPDTADALAKVLDWHLTERDYDQGCALRCGYDRDDRAAHLARALLDSGVLDAVKAEALREAADAIDPGDHDCFKSWCPHCAARKEREYIRTDLTRRAALGGGL